ncbi:hypothetical protein Ddc_05077 [Ditylenchus destructor]|nr:hypothetical protein Ddc_05077 [Ditylenchus destructor]
MHISPARNITLLCSRFSAKTGWAGYRLHRRGEHVVGTEPSIVEFHVVPYKKPEQPYGIQGTDHLIKDIGKVAATLPTKVYRWCMCGYSGAQPTAI